MRCIVCDKIMVEEEVLFCEGTEQPLICYDCDADIYIDVHLEDDGGFYDELLDN